MPIRRRTRSHPRKTKRLFVVSTEGALTEPIYFDQFHPGRDGAFRLKILRTGGGKSAPIEVAKRLFDFETRERPGHDTEYWAVIDRNSWEESAISEAYQWLRKRKNHHLALSDPCFEFWLYPHLRDNRSFSDCADCQRALKTIWPQFEKGAYDPTDIQEGISDAIRRARALDDSDHPWPIGQGTHVYRLVDKIWGRAPSGVPSKGETKAE